VTNPRSNTSELPGTSVSAAATSPPVQLSGRDDPQPPLAGLVQHQPRQGLHFHAEHGSASPPADLHDRPKQAGRGADSWWMRSLPTATPPRAAERLG
jgi:hypothetical protein